MRYTILLHYPEMQATGQLDDAALKQGMAAFATYAADLHAAGVLLSADVLHPSTATTTLRMGETGLQIQDGPFADTKEQLGGSFIIEVADLDAALSWARQAPSITWGAVEVRPTATHVVDGVWVASE